MNPERLTEIRDEIAGARRAGRRSQMIRELLAALCEATARAEKAEDDARIFELANETSMTIADDLAGQYEAAEAQARTLADALEQIEKYYATWWSPGDREFQAVVVARAALDEYKAKP